MKKTGPDSFECTVFSRNHKNGGEYLTHVYGDGTFIGKASYSLSCSPAAFYNAAKSYSQLIVVSVYDSTYADVTMYTNTGGVWKENFRTKGRVGKQGIGQAREGVPVTPRGMWCLYTPFGKKPDPGCTFKYTQVTANHYWSQLTNRLQTGYAPAAVSSCIARIPATGRRPAVWRFRKTA